MTTISDFVVLYEKQKDMLKNICNEQQLYPFKIMEEYVKNMKKDDEEEKFKRKLELFCIVSIIIVLIVASFESFIIVIGVIDIVKIINYMGPFIGCLIFFVPIFWFLALNVCCSVCLLNDIILLNTPFTIEDYLELEIDYYLDKYLPEHFNNFYDDTIYFIRDGKLVVINGLFCKNEMIMINDYTVKSRY